MSKKSLSTKKLAFCAMSLSLATVLAYLSRGFTLPTGGAPTLLSMLVISLPGYFFGLQTGIISAVAFGILYFIIDPFFLTPVQFLLDYIFSFGALGIAGLFKPDKSFGLIKGYILAVLGRYLFAVISGFVYFGEYAWEGYGALAYSLIYNGIYIFSEAIITIIILLIPSVKNIIYRIDSMANK